MRTSCGSGVRTGGSLVLPFSFVLYLSATLSAFLLNRGFLGETRIGVTIMLVNYPTPRDWCMWYQHAQPKHSWTSSQLVPVMPAATDIGQAMKSALLANKPRAKSAERVVL